MRVERVTWDGEEPAAMAAHLRSAASPPDGLREKVREIVERVRTEGDGALRELTAELDATDEPPGNIRVPDDEISQAHESADPELVEAMGLAAANIRAVAEAELRPEPIMVRLEQGHEVRVTEWPVAAAGVYAPGGRAAYPSSVLMGSIPARVAGVGRIALTSPPGPDGRLPAATLVAAHVAGVNEVHALGGAQAIAALALGTETIERVDVIAGPGNPWVTEAKRQLYGQVGIDGLAGPSELIVVADENAGAREIALDALAQAEHGADSPIAVVSTGHALLEEVAAAIAELGPDRPSVADAPLALVEVPSLEAALALSDAFAPEHLELCVDGAAELAAERIAGCVFVGESGATAFGDYAAGSNHILPTGGAARFSGPLGVHSFMRRTSVVDLPRDAAHQLAPAVDAFAQAEGLPVHGESTRARVTSETVNLRVD
ncbi:MAG: histidinol dehydrogenase [Actinomycetota bacterium]|nr:histidinol dehydrogenase [Actinomycetota bacterium]